LPRTDANVCEATAAFFDIVEEAGAAAAAAAADFLLLARSNLRKESLESLLQFGQQIQTLQSVTRPAGIPPVLKLINAEAAALSDGFRILQST
jgi:hypothetical protein